MMSCLTMMRRLRVDNLSEYERNEHEGESGGAAERRRRGDCRAGYPLARVGRREREMTIENARRVDGVVRRVGKGTGRDYELGEGGNVKFRGGWHGMRCGVQAAGGEIDREPAVA
jgi:hypothetical protein